MDVPYTVLNHSFIPPSLDDMDNSLIHFLRSFSDVNAEATIELVEIGLVPDVITSDLITAWELANVNESCSVVTLSNIIDCFLCLKNRTCGCLQRFEYVLRKEATEHVLLVLKLPPECDLIQLTLEYHLLERRMPSIDDLNLMLSNREMMTRDPDYYCNEQKHALPTVGLSKIKATKATLEDMCSICTDRIVPGASIYRLPGCGHIFHATAAECLDEGASIITWLQKNRQCPNCKAEIRFTEDEKLNTQPSRKRQKI